MTENYLSGKKRSLKLGISNYTEDKTTLEVIGNVGIGTTNPTAVVSVGNTAVLSAGIVTSHTLYAEHGNFTGVITATSFAGDGSALVGVAATDHVSSFNLQVAGISTFYDDVRVVRGGVDVAAGVVSATQFDVGTGGIDVDGQTDLDEVVVAGVSTFSALVDVNNRLDVVGGASVDQVIVAGVSTFTGNITAATAEFSGNVTIGGTLTTEDKTNVDSIGLVTARSGVRVTAGGIDVTAGVSTFGGLVNVDAGISANTAIIEDLTDNRVVIAGSGGELEDSANLTFDGTVLALPKVDVGTGGVDVDGQTDLDEVVVAGVTTFNQANIYVNTAVGTAITIHAGNIQSVGIITASKFIGDGSGLANLPGINTESSSVFTDIIVSGGANVTGVVTAASFSGSGANLTGIAATDHVSTFDLVVAGISTFNDDVRILGGGIDVTGVSTFNDNLHLLDSDKLLLGGSAGTHDGLEVYHSGSESNIVDSGTGVLRIGASQLNITNAALSETQAKFIENGAVELYHDNVKKFTTTAVGATVYGNSKATTLHIAGVSTFTGDVTFAGSVNQLNVTGITSAVQVDISTGGLDVDGETQLDEVVVAGVATFSNTVKIDGAVDIGTGGVDIDGQLDVDELVVAGVSTFSSAVDINSSLDVDGDTQVDDLNVAGVSTFSALIDANARLDVVGGANIDQLNVAGITTLNGSLQAKHEIIASGGLAVAGVTTTNNSLHAKHEVIASGGLTVAGVSTYSALIDANNRLDVVGGITADQINASGISSFAQLDVSTGGLDVDGQTDLDEVVVAGVSTFSGKAVFNTAYPSIDADNEIQVGTAIQLGKAGVITATSFSGSGANLTGIGTQGPDGAFRGLTVAGISTFHDDVRILAGGINAVGVITATSFSGSGANLTGIAATDHVACFDLQVAGVSTFYNDVKIVGGGSTAGNQITIGATTLNDGTLTFDGTAGQLFSISNNLTDGSIFSVNDVSGMPSIDVGAAGTIQLAPYGSGELVGIGTTRPTSKLDVVGDVQVVGVVTATSFSGDGSALTNVPGATDGSFIGLNVTGITTLGDDVRITAGGLNVASGIVSATQLDIGTGGIDVDGQSTLDEVVVAGASTFSSPVDINSSLDVDGDTQLDDLNVAGITTLNHSLQAKHEIIASGGLAVAGVITANNSLHAKHEVIASGGVNVSGVVTASSFAGDGSALTGIDAGGSGEFNVGFTSSVTMNATSYETTGYTFPSTVNKTYTIDSIMAANIANVGIGTTVNLITSISSNSGVAAGTTEQTYIAYNVPLAAGGAVELLKEPMVANPNDIVKLWATNDSYVGIASAVQVYMTYTQNDSTDFFGKYASNTSIASTTITGIHSAGTSYAAMLQSIHVTNRSDVGPFPVDLMLTDSTGIVTTYLVKNLVIPKYSAVEILERPKRMETGSTLGVKVQQTGTIDVVVSGKKYS